MTKKIYRIVLAIFLVSAASFCIFTLFYTRKKEYDLVIPVIVYSKSAQNYEWNGVETNFHIQGYVQRHLFKEATFSGKIWLDGFEIMKKKMGSKTSIEDNFIFYNFYETNENGNWAGSDIFSSVLRWDEAQEQFVLQIADSQQGNDTLYGMVAAGPYGTDEEKAALLSEGGWLAHYFPDGAPSYQNWDLADAFYDREEKEFTFLGLPLDDTLPKALENLGAILKEEAGEEFVYSYYGFFEDAGLAFDTVALDRSENGVIATVSFSFRDRDEYRAGRNALENCLRELPEEISEEIFFEGRWVYQADKRSTAEGTDAELPRGWLEVITLPQQQRIQLRVGAE